MSETIDITITTETAIEMMVEYQPEMMGSCPEAEIADVIRTVATDAMIAEVGRRHMAYKHAGEDIAPIAQLMDDPNSITITIGRETATEMAAWFQTGNVNYAESLISDAIRAVADDELLVEAERVRRDSPILER